MDTVPLISNNVSAKRSAGLSALRLAVRTTPLPFLNFALSQIIKKVTYKRPLIFKRLQGHHHKIFVISIPNLGLHLVLQPNPSFPQLIAHRKIESTAYDAKISGSLLALLGMVDGQYDGDALFFSRDLQLSGDTEAVVCLRNALDDMDGSIIEDAAACFGPLGFGLLDIARHIGKIHDNSQTT